MAKTAILAIKIISDAKDAVKGFDQAATGAERFKTGLNQASAVSAGVVAGMVAIGAASVKAASDAEQAAGAVQSVFGAASAEIQKYADNAAQTVGLAASQYDQLAAVLGAQLKNLGVAQTEVAGTTNNLIELGADLAATFGGTTADAVSALSALMRGERDPIERYGVSIKQADVNARLAAQGMGKLEGEAKKQAETQATLALLYEQTATAQGQFARESDTLAGQQQRLNAEFENAKASLGQALLPILTQLAGVLATVANWVNQNQAAFIAIAAVIGTLATAVIAVNAAYSAYQAISAIIAVVNGIQSASWFAVAAAELAALWPIALIVLAIVAVIAIVVLVVKNLDTLKEWWNIAFEAGRTAIQWCWDKLQALGSWIAGAFTSVVDAIGNVFSTAFGIAKRVVEAMLAPINAVISAIQSLIGWISNISFPSMPSWLSSLNPFALTAPGAYLAPAGGGPAPGGHATASRVNNVTINVNGAVDPIATGRQIATLLRTSGRGLGFASAVEISHDRSTY